MGQFFDIDAGDLCLMALEHVFWPQERPDITIAARVIVHREPSHQLVGRYDLLVQTDGHFGVWEHLSDHLEVADHRPADEDFRPVMREFLQRTLAQSMGQP